MHPCPSWANVGHLPALSVRGGGALANFARSRVGHLPTLGPPPNFWLVLASLSKLIYNTGFHGRHKQVQSLAHLSRTGKTCFLILYVSIITSLLIKKSLELLTRMKAYFLAMEWNFCWSRIWMRLAVIIFLISSTWSIYYLRNFLYFLQATRGDQNPNFQVFITHALHVCS